MVGVEVTKEGGLDPLLPLSKQLAGFEPKLTARDSSQGKLQGI